MMKDSNPGRNAETLIEEDSPTLGLVLLGVMLVIFIGVALAWPTWAGSLRGRAK